jgi:hypothetical protein
MPEDRPEYYWRRWPKRRYRPHNWYWYNWRDHRWYDWRFRGADQPPPQTEEPKNPYFKIDPSLMGNLLAFASSQQLDNSSIETILNNMIELSGDNWCQVLDMNDYEDIIDLTDTLPPPEIFDNEE